MAITAINREFNMYPNMVGMYTTDTLATITTTGYWTAQLANVAALNNGIWQWEIDALGNYTDIIYAYYSGGQGFLIFDPTNLCFDSLPTSAGFLSSTLANTHVFVGNASNVATGVALSGDATIANTGALTIAAGAVTGSKIANNAVDFANLALDVLQTATVALTATQIKGMYAAPVQLLAAPGAGKVIVIDNIFWDIAYGTTQYAGGGVIAAQYGATVDGGGPTASATIAAATLNGVAASGFLSQGAAALNVAATVENTAVYLSNLTGAFTTGDSTANLYVRYHVLTPA